MSARLAKIYSLIFVFIFLSFAIQASDDEDKKEILREYFSFEDSSCELKILPISKEHDYMKAMLTDKLKERDFKYKSIQETQEIRKNDLYLTFEVTYGTDKAYRDCIVETKIMRAKNNYSVSSSDKVMFTNKSKRSFPRITFEGKERCTRALRDSFIDIPICKLPQKKN